MGSSCYYIFKTSVNRRNQLVASITHLLEDLNEYCLIELDLAHTKLCIQFLDRENNDKNNTLALGKQIFII